MLFTQFKSSHHSELIWAPNLHQCLWTRQVCGSKRFGCHADLYTVSRCRTRSESEDHTSKKACKRDPCRRTYVLKKCWKKLIWLPGISQVCCCHSGQLPWWPRGYDDCPECKTLGFDSLFSNEFFGQLEPAVTFLIQLRDSLTYCLVKRLRTCFTQRWVNFTTDSYLGGLVVKMLVWNARDGG